MRRSPASKKVVQFEEHKPGRGGWTEWIAPVTRGYLMRCCDCGLVHEIDFRVVQQVTRTKRDGTWDGREPSIKGLRPKFRARRWRG